MGHGSWVMGHVGHGLQKMTHFHLWIIVHSYIHYYHPPPPNRLAHVQLCDTNNTSCRHIVSLSVINNLKILKSISSCTFDPPASGSRNHIGLHFITSIGVYTELYSW